MVDVTLPWRSKWKKVLIISTGLGPELLNTERGEEPENINTNCNSFIIFILTVHILPAAVNADIGKAQTLFQGQQVYDAYGSCLFSTTASSAASFSLYVFKHSVRKLHICPGHSSYTYMAPCLSSALTLYADRWTVRTFIKGSDAA